MTHDKEAESMKHAGGPAMNELRHKMVEAVERMYPIDSENAGALRFVSNGEHDNSMTEIVPQYVLIQTHHNGRRWHEFGDDLAALLKYAQEDEEWLPYCIIDLDTGEARQVLATCFLDDVVERFTAEQADPRFWIIDNPLSDEPSLPEPASARGGDGPYLLPIVDEEHGGVIAWANTSEQAGRIVAALTDAASLPVESIGSIVAYNLADEERDFKEHGEPEHHIFRDLARVTVWLANRKTAAE